MMAFARVSVVLIGIVVVVYNQCINKIMLLHINIGLGSKKSF